MFYRESILWNGSVIIPRKYSSPAALEVVTLTTSSAVNDEKFVKMMTFRLYVYNMVTFSIIHIGVTEHV